MSPSLRKIKAKSEGNCNTLIAAEESSRIAGQPTMRNTRIYVLRDVILAFINSDQGEP